MNIVCIEDSEPVRVLVVSVATRLGHSIDSFVDGSQADESIAKIWDSLDLVITDHNLPNLSGIEIVKRLRARGYSKRIIVYSSPLQTETRQQYLSFGVERILEKPAPIEEFRSAIFGERVK